MRSGGGGWHRIPRGGDEPLRSSSALRSYRSRRPEGAMRPVRFRQGTRPSSPERPRGCSMRNASRTPIKAVFATRPGRGTMKPVMAQGTITTEASHAAKVIRVLDGNRRLALWFGLATALPAEEAARCRNFPTTCASATHGSLYRLARAKDLLSRQGFAVTEEQFRQIFERDPPTFQAPLPVFITVDSAWHTYHVLLEEGVQQVETGQAKLLQRFSERLHQLAAARKDPANAVYGDLAAGRRGMGGPGPHVPRSPAGRRAGRGRRGPEGHEVGRTGTLLRTPLAGGELSPRRILHQDPGTLPLFRGAVVACHRGLPAEVGGGDAPCASSPRCSSSPMSELKRLHRQLTAPPEAMVGPTPRSAANSAWPSCWAASAGPSRRTWPGRRETSAPATRRRWTLSSRAIRFK